MSLLVDIPDKAGLTSCAPVRSRANRRAEPSSPGPKKTVSDATVVARQLPIVDTVHPAARTCVAPVAASPGTVEPLRTSTGSRGPVVGGALGVGVGGFVVRGGADVVALVVAVVVGADVGDGVTVGVGEGVGGVVVTPGVPLMTPWPLSKPPPHDPNATSNATTAATAIKPTTRTRCGLAGAR